MFDKYVIRKYRFSKNCVRKIDFRTTWRQKAKKWRSQKTNDLDLNIFTHTGSIIAKNFLHIHGHVSKRFSKSILFYLLETIISAIIEKHLEIENGKGAPVGSGEEGC